MAPGSVSEPGLWPFIARESRPPRPRFPLPPMSIEAVQREGGQG